MIKMYHHTKNQVSMSIHWKVIAQTDRHTDTQNENITSTWKVIHFVPQWIEEKDRVVFVSLNVAVFRFSCSFVYRGTSFYSGNTYHSYLYQMLHLPPGWMIVEQYHHQVLLLEPKHPHTCKVKETFWCIKRQKMYSFLPCAKMYGKVGLFYAWFPL